MRRFVIIDHPLVQVKLGLLRNRNTPSADFRRALRETAALMFFLATADLPVTPEMVQTPLAPCASASLTRPLVLAPILRAGLGLLEGVFDLVADAQIAHIGMYRDEETLKPVSYYAKVPPDIDAAEVILLDPMLATGHSASRRRRGAQGQGRDARPFSLSGELPGGHRALPFAAPRRAYLHGGGGRTPRRKRLHRPRLGRRGGSVLRDVSKDLAPCTDDIRGHCQRFPDRDAIRGGTRGRRCRGLFLGAQPVYSLGHRGGDVLVALRHLLLSHPHRERTSQALRR